jgi:class 3 adenylate cyclase
MIQPETRYTTVGNDRVAYQVLGNGPRDLLFTMGFWSHLDIGWEEPAVARFYRRLASFSRLILFDRRGTGVSDHPTGDGRTPVEHWLQDCLAVLDAAGAAAPVIVGASTTEVGALVLRFVGRHPERCSGLVFPVATACWAARPGYPQGLPPEAVEQTREQLRKIWGTAEMAAVLFASQAQAGNDAAMRWGAKWQRSVASPATMVENMDILKELDARDMLALIRIPTLVLGRSEYSLIPVTQTRYIADHIPGARFIELPGSDAALVWESTDLIVDLIEEFVTGRRGGGEPERAIVTILFTDIVDSTHRAAELGDSQWRQLLERHDRTVREQVALYLGKFIESSGDGTLTTFDSPARAIECAKALRVALKSLGIKIRAGLHTGEVELRDDGQIAGMAVHIGARVMSHASAGEVLVSPTVQGILVGSRYKFEPRGTHALKGVPGQWAVYAVDGKSG